MGANNDSEKTTRQSDLPDYSSPTTRPYTQPASGPAQAPAPPADPRSPVRQLLDLFELEEERDAALDASLNALFPWGPAAQSATPPPDAEVKKVLDDYAASQGRGDATTGASGADLHLSMSKVPFPHWHLLAINFPPEFDIPLRVPLSEVVARAVPALPPKIDFDEDEEEEGDGEGEERVFEPLTREPTFEEELSQIWEEFDDAQAKAEHDEWVQKGVEERIQKIKQARALMPVIPEGKYGGMLQKVSYTTVVGGSNTDDVGWMFVEPTKSEYGVWFSDRLKLHYSDGVEALKKIPEEKKSARDAAQVAVWASSAAIAVAEQEAAPSGINTYDARVLSWGVGLAAPGLLQKVMWEIVKDPKVWKTFYCCGFAYGCEIRTVKNSNQTQYHGIYQIVDVDKKAVVYGDNFHHRSIPGRGQPKKGDFHGKSFLALKAFTAQRELLHMLVQVARDPETRETVFKHNYDFVIANVTLADAAGEIFTEALYVFVAQVVHNWSVGTAGTVTAALRAMGRNLKDAPPSLDRDRLIARGIVRVLAARFQRERLANAVKAAKTGKYPKGLNEMSRVWQFPAKTEWGPKRFYTAYWKTLQEGTHARDGSKVQDPGFLVPNTEVPESNYRWTEPDGSMSFDLGPLKELKLVLLLPTEEMRITKVVDDHTVKYRTFGRKSEKWSLEEPELHHDL